MSFKDTFVDSLATEVLSDMADHFFGKRKEIDNSINTLDEFVLELRKKEKSVDIRAAFFCYLLITPEYVKAFYKTIGVSPDPYVKEGEISEDLFQVIQPSAFTRQGEYVKWIMGGYDELKRAVDRYMVGLGDDELRNFQSGEIDATYQLIENMCGVINEKIDQINHEMPPGGVLDCIRRYDPLTREKRHFTGGGSDYSDECMLNTALSFTRVECSSLGITQFPALPETARIQKDIASFAKGLYQKEGERIRKMMDSMKHHRRKPRRS